MRTMGGGRRAHPKGVIGASYLQERCEQAPPPALTFRRAFSKRHLPSSIACQVAAPHYLTRVM